MTSIFPKVSTVLETKLFEVEDSEMSPGTAINVSGCVRLTVGVAESEEQVSAQAFGFQFNNTYHQEGPPARSVHHLRPRSRAVGKLLQSRQQEKRHRRLAQGLGS